MIDSYKKALLLRAKTAKGHFDKVISMIENNEYCLDITNQTYAIQSALKKIDELLLEHHLKTCVRNSIESNENIDDKVNEVIEVFKRK